MLPQRTTRIATSTVQNDAGIWTDCTIPHPVAARVKLRATVLKRNAFQSACTLWAGVLTNVEKPMEKSNLKPGHLKRIKSLALLNDAQLAAFLNYIEVVNLVQGVALFQEGHPGNSMFLILEGQMRVVTRKRDSEDSLLLRMMEAGDSFGEIALLNQIPRSATVEATKPSVLIQIAAPALNQLLLEQPVLAAQFLFHVAKTLGRQLTDLTTKLRVRSAQVDLLSHCH